MEPVDTISAHDTPETNADEAPYDTNADEAPYDTNADEEELNDEEELDRFLSEAISGGRQSQRILALLKRATDEEKRVLLTLCDNIYYTTKPHRYKGVTYDLSDLPPDSVYTEYRKQFTPTVDVATLYIRGKKNVRDDEMIPHEYPMGSLAKFDSSTVLKLRTIFARTGTASNALVASLKIDGVSMQVKLTNGELVKATTRHDHKVGRSVITVANKFITRPDASFTGNLVINGEVVLCGNSYVELGFPHPRTGAAGIMNRKDGSDGSRLDYVAFDLAIYEPSESDRHAGWPAAKPALITEQFELLNRLGYKTPPTHLLSDKDLTEGQLKTLLSELAGATDAPSDGIVISPNSWVAELTDPPKMKVAYKGQSAGEWTIVMSVEPHATRTGNVIPQIVVETVQVGGSNISSIAGANSSILTEKGIMIGSRVLVIKAKEIIPFVAEVSNAEGDTIPVTIPNKCPACSTALVQKDRMLSCSNMQCPAKTLGRVEKFIDLIGLKGIGKTRLAALQVESIQELYGLSVREMCQFKNIAEKTAQSVYDQLRSCIAPISEASLLAAIGPPLISEKTAIIIVQDIPLDELFGPSPISLARLESVKRVGRERAMQLIGFQEEGRSIIETLRKHGLKLLSTSAAPTFNPPATFSQGTFSSSAGLAASSSAASSSAASSSAASPVKQLQHPERMCLTGKGAYSRNVYHTMIEKAGHQVSTTVSKNVTLVITDNLNGSSSTMEKARQEHKKIALYRDLHELLGLAY